ncbi:DNA lyase [archaeon]|nr:DNA lyase [archaeon]|tara:strand:- start:2354 stop:2968 length:615 start_codon:yes stop_codon:yes gene_type:complete
MYTDVCELKKDYQEKKTEITNRLQEFRETTCDDYFYELCFCLLTPQTKGRRADLAIQKLKEADFQNQAVEPVYALKKYVRFHNTKATRLLVFKEQYKDIFLSLAEIEREFDKRAYLVQQINGLGMKEASHYLRNIGYKGLAILDRHILRCLVSLQIIKKMPKTLTVKQYIEIERRFSKFSREINIQMDALDLLFWSDATGEIFK